MSSKVAIVTGAGSGIGKHTTLAFLDAGYSVTLAGRREDPLKDTVREAERRGFKNARCADRCWRSSVCGKSFCADKREIWTLGCAFQQCGRGRARRQSRGFDF